MSEPTSTDPRPDYSHLSAVFLNTTLKRSPERSHTDGLIEASVAVMHSAGVSTEVIRSIDHPIATGVYPDMTEHGWDEDAWPGLCEKILAADVLVLAGPIWLGNNSSEMVKVIERLYGMSGELNEHGQSIFYGRTGGAIFTGNEDGIKHCSMTALYSMQHVGFTIPPQADAGWVGEAGPGPSYLDEGSGGPENDFTNRNTTIMTWNLLHLAAMMRSGIPSYGNDRNAWGDGQRFGFEENPEYR